jgi:hypothetical protein
MSGMYPQVLFANVSAVLYCMRLTSSEVGSDRLARAVSFTILIERLDRCEIIHTKVGVF